MTAVRRFTRMHPLWSLLIALVIAWLVFMALFAFGGSGSGGGLHPVGR